MFFEPKINISYVFVYKLLQSRFARAHLQYDVIASMHEECWYLFWYHWIEEAHSYTLVPN